MGTPTPNRTTYFAIPAVCAIIAGAAVMAAQTDSGRAVAGSGNGAVNTYDQPTPTAMTMGPTTAVAPAATTLATTLASPTAKASPLPAECSMPGMCP